MGPAIKGTNNVLVAAKELGVKRVVITSSISAIVPSRHWPADVVKNEDCWTDVEYCKQKEVRLLSLLLILILCMIIELFELVVSISTSESKYLSRTEFQTWWFGTSINRLLS